MSQKVFFLSFLWVSACIGLFSAKAGHSESRPKAQDVSLLSHSFVQKATPPPSSTHEHPLLGDYRGVGGRPPVRIMSNGSSRARYALSFLRETQDLYLNADLLGAFLQTAREHQAGGVGRQLEIFLEVSASEADFAALRSEAYRDTAQTIPFERFQVASQLREALHVRSQVNACIQDGDSPEVCCKSMLLPWALFASWRRLPQEVKAQHIGLARKLGHPFWEEMAWGIYEKGRSDAVAHAGERGLSVEFELPFSTNVFGQKVEVYPLFKARGIDAWLTTCTPILNGNIGSLDEFRQRYGDYRDWPSQFIAQSAAKRLGRRIYRHPTRMVSVAETIYVGPESVVRESLGRSGLSLENRLNAHLPDCEVTETEAIAAEESGTLRFWSFVGEGRAKPYSVFADMPMNQERTPPTPFSCVGCHYDLETRLVDVFFPDAHAIGIDFETSRAVRRSASDCLESPF